MIYIHRLRDLNPKTAEVESTQIIREIKRKSSLPFAEQYFQAEFFTYFMSDTDRQAMQSSLDLVPSVIEEMNFIASANNPVYELINFKRAVSALNEIPPAIAANLKYAEETKEWSTAFIQDLCLVLNNLNSLRSNDEKVFFNKKLSDIFARILRNEQMMYNSDGIVGEGILDHITALDRSMKNGFLFHVHLEEEIKKINFEFLKQRIPVEELEKVERLSQRISEIKKGVERAYENNMRMLQLAVLVYSYFRMVANR